MSALAKRLRSLQFVLVLEILRPFSLPATLRLLHLFAAFSRLVPSASACSRQRAVNLLFRRYLTYVLLLHDARRYKHLYRVDGLKHLQNALDQGHGAVILSSKVGLPRLLRWHLRTCHPNTLYLLLIGFASSTDNSFAARFQRWHWTRFHSDRDQVIGNEPLSAQYMTRAYRHLRANGLVNIAGDGGTGNHRFPVTIAGRRHELAAGGISLGILSGAAIIPCFTVMEPGDRFRIEFQAPLSVPLEPDRDTRLRQLVAEYAGRIDTYIRTYPENVVAPRYAGRHTQ